MLANVHTASDFERDLPRIQKMLSPWSPNFGSASNRKKRRIFLMMQSAFVSPVAMIRYRDSIKNVLTCNMQHCRSLHRFTDFSCLKGAALTISPGHMVRAVDLNMEPLYITSPQILIFAVNFTNTALEANSLISLIVLCFNNCVHSEGKIKLQLRKRPEKNTR